jgi:HIV Tat-specific factor 1
MNGRYFAGRRIEAFLSDGKTKYRKSGKGDLQDDAEEKARLDKFAEYLEAGGGTMAQDERIEPSVAAGAHSTAAATTDGS